jgi:importin-4
MAQSLELLLIQFLMPDNDARRQAEEQIRRLARDPQVVPALVHHLRTAKTPNVRQLAAVLLRKKITSHWPKLPLDSKASLKQALIDSITLDHRSFTDHLSPTPSVSFPYVCLRILPLFIHSSCAFVLPA